MPMMKAVQLHRFGAEDVLQYDEVAIPPPGPREILIKVQAAAINHRDLFIRQNGNIHIGPADLPLILGSEVTGTVAEMGSNISEFSLGQRVVALPAVQTRAAGTPGGKEYTGCYAQYVLARPQDTRPLPDDIDAVTGVAGAWASLTAWYALRAGQIKSGDLVLVHSGGSGVGVAAIQFAKHLGARVITTTGSAEKCARALSLGAEAAFNYEKQDFETEVMRLTAGRGVDLLIETMGGEVYGKSLKVLATNGRMIALGSLTGGAPALLAAAPPGRSVKRFSITATLMEDPHAVEQLDQFFDLMRQGKLKVIVDRTFPLSEAGEAHRYIAERRNFGKVVLTT
ncbi:MAG: zinc-binding alcohol dehydrogenase family protein [Burkholderiales bacterium]